MQVDFRLKLGIEGRDKITGFKGIITSVCYSLYGCHQYCIVPPADKEGKLVEGKWFDDGRVDEVGIGINPKEVVADSGNGNDNDNMPNAY